MRVYCIASVVVADRSGLGAGGFCRFATRELGFSDLRELFECGVLATALQSGVAADLGEVPISWQGGHVTVLLT